MMQRNGKLKSILFCFCLFFVLAGCNYSDTNRQKDEQDASHSLWLIGQVFRHNYRESRDSSTKHPEYLINLKIGNSRQDITYDEFEAKFTGDSNQSVSLLLTPCVKNDNKSRTVTLKKGETLDIPEITSKNFITDKLGKNYQGRVMLSFSVIYQKKKFARFTVNLPSLSDYSSLPFWNDSIHEMLSVPYNLSFASVSNDESSGTTDEKNPD